MGHFVRVVLCLSLPAAHRGPAGGTFIVQWSGKSPRPLRLLSISEMKMHRQVDSAQILALSALLRKKRERPRIRMRSDYEVSLFILDEITIPLKRLRHSFLLLRETLESMNLRISINSKELLRNGLRPFL